MNDEALEEWDADFLDQLIQVEELALSSTKNCIPFQNLSQNQPPFPHIPPPLHPSQHLAGAIRYSPPRELSQRTNHSSFDPYINLIPKTASSSKSVSTSESANELEIKRLKRELGFVSEQLTHLKNECHELRKERDEKVDQHRFVSLSEEKDAHVHLSKNKDLEFEVRTVVNNGASMQLQNAKASYDQVGYRHDIAMPTCKAIGVQTGNTGDASYLNDDLRTKCLSERLLAIWGYQSDQQLGRTLISKLFVTCPTDFQVLFACLSLNMSSKITRNSLEDDGLSVEDMHSLHIPETTKVAHVYSMLTKISNGMARVEALLEPLLDLCSLKNVVIVHSSLRILHVILKQLLSMERKSEGRENVTIEGLSSQNNIAEFHGYEDRGLFSVNRDEMSSASCIPHGFRFSEADIRRIGNGIEMPVNYVDWTSFFDVMLQISTRNTDECVRVESLSIMNIVLRRSNAYTEREKFGHPLVFENISQLLKKEAGFLVQNQALHLLYLLLNCPKLLIMFCSGCKEDGSNAGDIKDNASSTLTFQGFNVILEGLADCVACCGCGMQVLKLRKMAIVVLAFIASSGKSGFETLLRQKLSRETNFLTLILQVLVSEMEAEAVACPESPDIFRERTLLVREALILLNRLVSSPAYSATVLRELTSSRDMASLTIEIANRLSWKDQRRGQYNMNNWQTRESEIVDLARVFKKRVFTYLGDSIS